MLCASRRELQKRSKTCTSPVVESHSFNVRNQLTGIETSYNNQGLLNLGYDYTYDGPNMGRIRARTDAYTASQSTRYVYDSLDRLKEVHQLADSWPITWGYDFWGNRTSQTPMGLGSLVGAQTFGYTNNRNNSFLYDCSNGNCVATPGARAVLWAAQPCVRCRRSNHQR